MSSHLYIEMDAAPLAAALKSLSDIAQIAHEVVQSFLGRLDSLSQLVRVDRDAVGAAGASQCRIVFQPSDLLVEFLASQNSEAA